MKRELNTHPTPALVYGRMSPTDGSGDADTPPRPLRGHTGARTGPVAADPSMPGQTEIELRPMQPTLWSL